MGGRRGEGRAGQAGNARSHLPASLPWRPCPRPRRRPRPPRRPWPGASSGLSCVSLWDGWVGWVGGREATEACLSRRRERERGVMMVGPFSPRGPRHHWPGPGPRPPPPRRPCACQDRVAGGACCLWGWAVGVWFIRRREKEGAGAHRRTPTRFASPILHQQILHQQKNKNRPKGKERNVAFGASPTLPSTAPTPSTHAHTATDTPFQIQDPCPRHHGSSHAPSPAFAFAPAFPLAS